MDSLIIDEYIEAIEISTKGILIKFEQRHEELISWNDERIMNFLPK